MKKITRYFLEGLLLIIPSGVTIYFFYYLLISVDSLFKLKYPGLGFVISVGIIILVGFIASNIFTKGIVRIVDSMFSKLPFIKIIYTSLRDLTEAFVGDKKKFNQPVLVNLKEDGSIQIPGFITETDLSAIGSSGKVAVYLPQSYNFAGNLLLVNKDDLVLLQVESTDLMTFIVSGGFSYRIK